MVESLSPSQLQAWLSDPERPAPLVLDVREPWETELCRLPDVVLMPLDTLPEQWQRLDIERQIVCVCHHGIRSRHAAAFLDSQGVPALFNLTGGMDAWAREIDPKMQTY